MVPLLAYVVSAAVTIGGAASPRIPEYPHVRTTDARFAKTIADAAQRSPTFARLYRALQQTDVILFVEPSGMLDRSLRGRLLFLNATPLARYLRADIRVNLSQRELVETIAHEMQHALEVAYAEEVRDPSSMDKYYRRAGRTTREHRYDTEFANVIAWRVRMELV